MTWYVITVRPSPIAMLMFRVAEGCSVSAMHCPECQTTDACQRAGACMDAADEPDKMACLNDPEP